MTAPEPRVAFLSTLRHRAQNQARKTVPDIESSSNYAMVEQCPCPGCVLRRLIMFLPRRANSDL